MSPLVPLKIELLPLSTVKEFWVISPYNEGHQD